MKSEDFKELQDFCEKKGYQLLNESLDDNTKFFVVSKKKDEWEGVEFVKCNFPDSPMLGRIRRIINVDPTSFDICIEGEKRTIWSRYGWEPSTEAAYIEQLKAEAFKRYGEIKVGDTFTDETDFIRTCDKGLDNFHYLKEKDILFAFGARIYQQGKWATRVPERVKVSVCAARHIDSHDHRPAQQEYTFWVEGTDQLDKSVPEFLASALEKYLNHE